MVYPVPLGIHRVALTMEERYQVQVGDVIGYMFFPSGGLITWNVMTACDESRKLRNVHSSNTIETGTSSSFSVFNECRQYNYNVEIAQFNGKT